MKYRTIKLFDSELKNQLYGIFIYYKGEISVVTHFIKLLSSHIERSQKKKGENFEQNNIVVSENYLKKVLAFLKLPSKKQKSKSKEMENKLNKYLSRYYASLGILKGHNILAEMALSYLISYQEAYIYDYLKVIFSSRTDLLKSNKTLTHEEICEFNSFKDIVGYMALKEVKSIFEDKGIDGMNGYFLKKFKINIEKKFSKWRRLREASYRRNLVIHNKGITDELYCHKTGYKKIGHHLNTNISYVLKVADCIFKFIEFINTNIFQYITVPVPQVSD